MRIEKVGFKNFASYGNVMQELTFDEDVGYLHLVLGNNGFGKCLDPDTEIEIEIEDQKIKEDFLLFLEKKAHCYMGKRKMIKCNLQDLFEFEKNTGHVSSKKIKVKTRYGNRQVSDIQITAKASEVYEIRTEKRSVKSSPDHLFFFKDWKKAKTFKVGDSIETIDGIEIVEDIKIHKDKKDLLDIEVESVKEFFANGFVSHNSTLANVVKFLCYGKVDGMNNSDLPNRINKNLWGYIELFTRSKHVRIERGLSPNVFKVYVDGVEYDQAGKLNTQDYLEDELFEIPYNVFKNVIILSINDFKSFLTMTPGDKKAIVDRIFGFSVINEMYENIKRQRRDIKAEIKTLESEIQSVTESIQSVLVKMTEMEKNKEEKNVEKIHELKNKLESLVENKKRLLEAKEKIQTKFSETEKEINAKRKFYVEVTNEFAIQSKRLQLYENNQCPTCHSDLTSDYHKHLKEEIEKTVIELKDKRSSMEKEINDTRESNKDLQGKQNAIIMKISSLDANIQQYKKQIVELVKNTEKTGVEEFDNLVEEFKKKESEKNKTRAEKLSEENYLQLLETILGEGGIKNLAMQMILPALNRNVQQMAKMIHLPFQIKFDDKFNSVITHLGEEISPKTLSTGERKKADFVIIIALIKLLKNRYPTLNLLFLDEIFSSVDSDGVYHILQILHQVIKETRMNAFVINHTVLPSELFDKRIEITKDSGFSRMKIETIS